ncbi:MAG: S8 family serine peptidase, partial [Blastocatellia bacterium]
RDQAGKNSLEVWLPNPVDPKEKIPNPDFKESGAIMVGAVGQNMQPRSNYGSRVNCFALGEDVFSTNVLGGYTHRFNGTSSASAIVAGVALSVLGIIANKGLSAKTPEQIRAL